MKIATMATGGIGGYLAVKLSQAGHQIACVARGAHLSAIQTQGLKLNSPLGQEVIRPWKVSEDPAEIGPVDAIIFVEQGAVLTASVPSVFLPKPDTLFWLLAPRKNCYVFPRSE